ncbi:MAG: MIP family channel protein, partial [Nocardioides sp.]|uniref:MIP/aquaporin family protein n=1 Tax=Nocardioides sp. TaxID=35761 RepID=UPI0039E2AEC6
MTQETTSIPPVSAPAAEGEPTEPVLAQKLTAEMIGTFILVLFGCGAALAGGLKAGEAAFNGTTGLAFGLAVVIGVYAFGRISGAHFNPAVSVGAAFGGRISWIDAAYYIVAQIVGAIIAAFVLWVVWHGFSGFSSTDSGLAADTFGSDANGFHWWAALIVEIVLTAVFVFVILSVTDVRNEHPNLAPLAIGLTLAAIHFMSIPLTGTSVNPARSIGPALFSGSGPIKDLVVFIPAPLIGAAIAGIVYPILFGRGSEPVPGSGMSFASRPAAVPAPAGWGAGSDQFQREWNQTGAESQSWGAPAPQAPAAHAAPPA